MTRLVATAALVLLLAGCSASTPGPVPGHVPSSPSVSARMVCTAEAQEDIAQALGVSTSQAPTSTWADGLFTCRYVYPSGTMVLTVKELPDATSTVTYFASLRSGVAAPKVLPALGQEAFSSPDGIAAVRKDTKVLRVDTTGLPEGFGQPPHTRTTTAIAVAVAVMLCWTGA